MLRTLRGRGKSRPLYKALENLYNRVMAPLTVAYLGFCSRGGKNRILGNKKGKKKSYDNYWHISIPCRCKGSECPSPSHDTHSVDCYGNYRLHPEVLLVSFQSADFKPTYFVNSGIHIFTPHKKLAVTDKFYYQFFNVLYVFVHACVRVHTCMY